MFDTGRVLITQMLTWMPLNKKKNEEEEHILRGISGLLSSTAYWSIQMVRGYFGPSPRIYTKYD